jgi:hypothetical protein
MTPAEQNLVETIERLLPGYVAPKQQEHAIITGATAAGLVGAGIVASAFFQPAPTAGLFVHVFPLFFAISVGRLWGRSVALITLGLALLRLAFFIPDMDDFPDAAWYGAQAATMVAIWWTGIQPPGGRWMRRKMASIARKASSSSVIGRPSASFSARTS